MHPAPIPAAIAGRMLARGFGAVPPGGGLAGARDAVMPNRRAVMAAERDAAKAEGRDDALRAMCGDVMAGDDVIGRPRAGAARVDTPA